MTTRFPIILVIANFAGGLVLHARAQDSGAEQTVPIKIYFDQKIKMRDGIALSPMSIGPTAPTRLPCILNRTPYLKSSAGTAEFGKYGSQPSSNHRI
jgi:predicted acyl esterase